MGRGAMVVGLTLALALALAGGGAAAAETAPPVGTVAVVTGSAQVGSGGLWEPAVPRMPLFEGQAIRTAAASSVEVLFEGAVPARLGEKSEIAVSDLLLKARLEQLRTKIAAPEDATKADIQVTPLTGVRGTEKAEEKAESLKREHYWSESAPDAK